MTAATTDHRFGVGVISEGHGLRPHVLLIPNLSRIMVGYNDKIAVIDTAKLELVSNISCETLFYQFIHLPDIKMVVAIHETGVIALTEVGEPLWDYNGDIIEQCEYQHGCLILNFNGGSSTTIGVENGKPCN